MKTRKLIEKLKEKNQEYSDLENDTIKEGATFEETLALIERVTQRTIDPFITSTKRWITIQNDYINYVNSLKKGNNGSD